LFEKCGFKGAHIEICDDVKDVQAETNFKKIESVYIPKKFDSLPVVLHTDKNFKGKSRKLNESESCLK